MAVGRTLSEAAIKRARGLGYTAIYLDTMPGTMQAANRIYAELGFLPVERYADSPVLREAPGCEANRSPEVVFFRRTLP